MAKMRASIVAVVFMLTTPVLGFPGVAQRAALPQIIGEIPWETETPAATPAYTHHNKPTPVTFCGVPGTSCQERVEASDSVGNSTTIGPMSVGITSNATSTPTTFVTVVSTPSA